MSTLHDSDTRAIVLKTENRTRIEVRDHQGLDATFRKVYRTPVRLRWRTFLLPSKARREFRALRAAFDAGLPCIEPLAYREERRLACVAASEVTSRYVAGRSLKAVLARGLASRNRRDVCIQLGELLARFHESGVLWMSAMPRNVILSVDDAAPLVACDLPYGLAFGRSIAGRGPALVDLYSMGFSKSRTEDFTPTDQRAFLLAYCHGNRSKYRRLAAKLGSRSKRRQTVHTTMLHGGRGILLPALHRILYAFSDRTR